jgi:DNA-binding NtrC family response regulator
MLNQEATMVYQDNCGPIESPTALIAEDDQAARARVTGFLRSKGYEVLEAGTSMEALLLAVDYPGRIDALFTSTRLRKYCNGSELAAGLRAARPEMAVFFMDESGSPDEAVTRELLQGTAVLLAKPLSLPRLQEAFDLLEENRNWAGTASGQPEWI